MTQAALPVVLDFGATWCGPCKKLEPIIEELGKEKDGSVIMAKVDVGEAPTVTSFIVKPSFLSILAVSAVADPTSRAVFPTPSSVGTAPDSCA